MYPHEAKDKFATEPFVILFVLAMVAILVSL